MLDRSLWEPLQRFESRDYLSQFYKKKHERTLNATRLNEIGSCFTQGREYFVSAGAASETVKPLLLYYGVSSLARGVTLLRDKTKNEENLTAGHGLVTEDWSATLASGISHVLDLKVKCSRGTFSEFVTAVGNTQEYVWQDQQLRLGYFHNDFGSLSFLTDGSPISLDDMLCREPELISDYEIANADGRRSNLGTIVALEESIKVLFMPSSGVDVPAMLRGYKFPKSAIISKQPHPAYKELLAVCVEIPAVGEDRKRVLPMAWKQEKPLGWTVQPLPNGDNLIDAHRIYIEAYILGMLSRYYPSKWMAILRSEKGDIARSVILATIARIEVIFPDIVRKHLAR